MTRGPWVFALAACLLVCACDKSRRKSRRALRVAAGTASTNYGQYTGPQTGLVRSVTLKTTGAREATIQGSGEGQTARYAGSCASDVFANFVIEMTPQAGGFADERMSVSIASKDPITPGQTGEIPLSWLAIEFMDEDQFKRYRGSGTLTIGQHDATKGAPRLVGTLKGKLDGRDDEEGKLLDAEASFDLNVSCGTK